MRNLVAPFAVVVGASVAVAAHAQTHQASTNVGPGQGPAMQPVVMRIHVPPSFAHVLGESVTVNGRTVSKASLLAQIDPATPVTLPSGRVLSKQQLLDGVGRSEDKAKSTGTTLRAIQVKRSAMINPAGRITTQKQKLAASRARLATAKAGGWASSFVEHLTAGSPSPDRALTRTTVVPPSRRLTHRSVSACAIYPGHFPSCAPDFSSIDAPPWSQDVGDPNVVGATTSFSMAGSTSPAGDQSTCSLEWDNVGQIFGTSWDVLRVSGSETTNAKNSSFSGSLAIYVAGAALTVPDDGALGGDGSLLDDSYSVSAGGKFPLVGPIYLELSFNASAALTIALVGERRTSPADPAAVPPPPAGGGGNRAAQQTVVPSAGQPSPVTLLPGETHGAHCHVGVQPSFTSDVNLTAGIGFGIDDLIDLMHIEVTGDVKPINASLPTHVTLDLQRAPPGGQIAFDSHLNATFMQSQLSFDWQIFDVCWTVPVVGGTVCLLHDILQIPTSGSVVIAQDEGYDPIDMDLAGGGRAIRWKNR